MDRARTNGVDFYGAFLGQVFSIIAFLVVCAAVYKIFQVSTDLREIKGLLEDIKRNTYTFGPPPAAEERRAPGPMTPEELVRAVHSGAYDDSAPLEPTVIPPQA